MKKYLMDQVGYLITMIIIANCVPFLFGTIATIVLELFLVVSTGYLCRRLLLLLIDLFVGTITEDAYFLSVAGAELSLFSQNKFFFKWKLQIKDGIVIVLLLPYIIDCNSSDSKLIEVPCNGRKVTIEYYKYSKILKRIAQS